jgi:phospholipase C
VKIKIARATGMHKIRQIVIMQENRSSDSYFGTVPQRRPDPGGVCVPDPVNEGCVGPFHHPSDLSYGGPHGASNAVADIDGSRMDGVRRPGRAGHRLQHHQPGLQPVQPAAAGGRDAAAERVRGGNGYLGAREIPNYWTYAKDFVLQKPHV